MQRKMPAMSNNLTDPSPLFSVCRQPHHFGQWATTPVHNIMHPPSWWSASMSVPIHHAQSYLAYDIHGQVTELPLLYNVHDREIPLHFVSDAIVGNPVFPAYFSILR